MKTFDHPAHLYWMKEHIFSIKPDVQHFEEKLRFFDFYLLISLGCMYICVRSIFIIDIYEKGVFGFLHLGQAARPAFFYCSLCTVIFIIVQSKRSLTSSLSIFNFIPFNRNEIPEHVSMR